MATKDELKKASELLNLKELENVEGGAAAGSCITCESSCLWSGKNSTTKKDEVEAADEGEEP
jgi:hypothetical protein